MKKESRRLLVLSQGEQHSRASVQEGICRRSGRGQNNRVDDGWQGGDSGTVDGDNPWGLGGTSGSVCNCGQQTSIIIRDKHANGERAEYVEEEDTPEHTSDSLGDVAAGVLSLTGSDCNHLNSTIRESSVHKSRPEAQEATGISSRDIRLHCSGVLPVSEAKTVVGWATTEIKDKGKEQKTHDRNDLDRGKDELGFSVYRDGEDVQAKDDDDDNRDPG